MHDGEALVRVLLRGRVLEIGARLYGADAEGPLFLALRAPLPVGTLLEIEPMDDGGGEPWVFAVQRVVEALWQGPGGHRGCYGARVAVDREALAEWGRRVGSEHLADGVAARRLRLCPTPADADGDPAAPAGASVIILHSAPDRSPRAAGGGKRRRGRARP